MLTLNGINVKHPETMLSVSHDGESLGEIMLKGSKLVRSKPGSTSTVVVEFKTIVYSHPLVTNAAVVAMSHPPWGKMPYAFLNTKSKIKEEGVISWPRKLKHCLPEVLIMERNSYPILLYESNMHKNASYMLRNGFEELEVPDVVKVLSTGCPVLAISPLFL
ncbi:hypothetical protein KI387_035863 [Taxus chinensis]|uniref:AMP-binding enzyme C-terminal domain-containing protein n=1 Tax=Taxus chinensis TaxID=29808 RepID=A0AA38FNP0_TAXCH|nr:hypothetical protein KI387_035863 [Taxus chinensis]